MKSKSVALQPPSGPRQPNAAVSRSSRATQPHEPLSAPPALPAGRATGRAALLLLAKQALDRAPCLAPVIRLYTHGQAHVQVDRQHKQRDDEEPVQADGIGAHGVCGRTLVALPGVVSTRTWA